MRSKLALFMLCLFCIVPFVTAQDNGDDDIFVPIVPEKPVELTEEDIPLIPTIPNYDDDDDVEPIDPDTITLATPMQEEMIEYPTPPINVHPATPMEEELIEYPTTPQASDPCADDGDELTIPMVNCNPTVTPAAPTSEARPWTEVTTGLYWRRYVGSATRSGDCSDYEGGDNDGPSGNYEDPEDPGQQSYVCTWPQKGIVMVDNSTFYWRNGEYTTDTSIDSYDGSSYSRQLNVIDPATLEIVMTTNAGACTITHVIRFELITAGTAFGCTTSIPEESQEETEPEPTPVPGEEVEEEPEVIEPPLIIEGKYTVRWLPFDEYCAQSYAPTFGEVTLVKASEDDVKLYINGEVFNLTGERIRGEYTLYGDNVNVTLNRRFADDFNFVWQASNDDYSESCYAQAVLSLGGELTADERAGLSPVPPPVPADPGPITINPDGSYEDEGSDILPTFAPVTISDGSYSANWEPLEGICTSTDLLPNFETATLTASDNGYVLTYDGGSYAMEDFGGMVFYTGSADGFTESVMVESTTGGQVKINFGKFGDDGVSMCMATLTLTGQ